MRHVTLSLTGLFLLGLGSACVQGDYCADYFPNATITDVYYSENEERAFVSLYHHLSYCTGTDEKRFSIELLDIDLAEATFSRQHRTSNSPALFDLSEECCPLFYQGQFASEDRCDGCELILNTQGAGYTFHFTTAPVESGEVMDLEILAQGQPILRFAIGGYETSSVTIPP